MASPSAEAIHESTLSFLLAENPRAGEREGGGGGVGQEGAEASGGARDAPVLSLKRGDRGSRVEAAAWWFMAKTGGSPPAQGGIQILLQQLVFQLSFIDPGGASDPVHRQTL